VTSHRTEARCLSLSADRMSGSGCEAIVERSGSNRAATMGSGSSVIVGLWDHCAAKVKGGFEKPLLAGYAGLMLTLSKGPFSTSHEASPFESIAGGFYACLADMRRLQIGASRP
jgi:hypothetical protein